MRKKDWIDLGPQVATNFSNFIKGLNIDASELVEMRFSIEMREGGTTTKASLAKQLERWLSGRQWKDGRFFVTKKSLERWLWAMNYDLFSYPFLPAEELARIGKQYNLKSYAIRSFALPNKEDLLKQKLHIWDETPGRTKCSYFIYKPYSFTQIYSQGQLFQSPFVYVGDVKENFAEMLVLWLQSSSLPGKRNNLSLICRTPEDMSFFYGLILLQNLKKQTMCRSFVGVDSELAQKISEKQWKQKLNKMIDKFLDHDLKKGLFFLNPPGSLL